MSLPRPREQLEQIGATALGDVQLLALLLGTGTSRYPAEELAAALLTWAGDLGRLAELGPGALSEFPGIGPVKAARLAAAFELARRIAARPLIRGQPLCSSGDVAAWFTARLGREMREYFLAVSVDSRNRPMGERVIGIGGLSSCSLTPADVFRPLVRDAVSGVIFVHNHPSGEPDPSPDDIALTAQLVMAGDLMGIRVLDHIIVAKEGYFSFADAGIIGRDKATVKQPRARLTG